MFFFLFWGVAKGLELEYTFFFVMSELTIATLNVRGLKMRQRRTAFFNSLKYVYFDILFLQECHLESCKDEQLFAEGWNKGPSVWGAGNVKADGVGILFNSWDFEIESVVKGYPGRVMRVDARWRGVNLRFINVYAPSKRCERVGFFNCLKPFFFTNRKIVFGGDLNTSWEKETSGELAQLIRTFTLRDSFRVAGDGTNGVTWRNSRGDASRIDYLFFQPGVKLWNFFSWPTWLSDHCMIGIKADIGEVQRGRGSWRFNTSLLQDSNFCDIFTQLYRAWQNLRGFFESQAQWWEDVKKRIAKFCQWWGKNKARQERRLIQGWTEKLQKMWIQGDLKMGGNEFYALQEKIKTFFMKEAEKLLLETGFRKHFLDEKPSKYFFATVRKRQKTHYIERLKGEGGIVSSTCELLETAANYYKKLFSPQDTVGPLAGKFLDSMETTLGTEEATALEGEVTVQEVERALRSLKKGTAPGCDGLPVDFYCFFWPLISGDLVAVYKECLASGLLPQTMRTGHVSLLYKKGDREDLANWRPITLLTTDYKMLAKVLVLRIKTVIGKVVHSDQTSGVPGRSSIFNLIMVRDAIDWAEQRQLPLAILSLDQEKASTE